MIKKKDRERIYERDAYRCVACMNSYDLTVHHRVNRGMGGSKMVDSPAHLLTVCNTCNTAFESSADKAETARNLGYKIRKNHRPPIDPTTVPVWYSLEGKWFLLSDDYTKKEHKNG